MRWWAPSAWPDALQLRSEHPDLAPIAGGTDLMVELNARRRKPRNLLDLTRIGELKEWSCDGDMLRIGAGVTFSRIIDEIGDRLPGLTQAAETVGSAQIRHRATLGGNLASASPAGDGHPPLLASGAMVEVESVRGLRLFPIADFFTGPKCHSLALDELVRAVLVPRSAGTQEFAKVGPRSAMVIAICSFAVALDTNKRTVGTGMGACAPTPRAAVEAQQFATEELPWDTLSGLDESIARHFGELVAKAAEPIDDLRGAAAYRRHALAVVARRTLSRAWKGSLRCD